MEGLEGEEITPINSKDVLYTITDSAMYEVIAYGRPNAGMTPFGKAYGGELSKSEIDYMITFMRYMWDDRFEAPRSSRSSLLWQMAKCLRMMFTSSRLPNAIVSPVTALARKTTIILMTSYEEILTTGDNAENNIIAATRTAISCKSFRNTPSWIRKNLTKN